MLTGNSSELNISKLVVVYVIWYSGHARTSIGTLNSFVPTVNMNIGYLHGLASKFRIDAHLLRVVEHAIGNRSETGRHATRTSTPNAGKPRTRGMDSSNRGAFYAENIYYVSKWPGIATGVGYASH